MRVILILVMVTSPLVIFAQNTVDPSKASSGTGITYECVTGNVYGNCTWDDLIAAVKKITNWGAQFALIFSVVIIAYAGFLYMTSGGSAGQRDKANKMFVSVAKGIFFILAAWLIVNLITTSLLSKDFLSSVPLK